MPGSSGYTPRYDDEAIDQFEPYPGPLIAKHRSIRIAHHRVKSLTGGTISMHSIHRCCNGFTKTAGGYDWRYASDTTDKMLEKRGTI